MEICIGKKNTSVFIFLDKSLIKNDIFRHKRTHGTRDNHGAQNGGVNGEKSRIGRKRKTNPNSEELPNLPKKPVEKDIKCPACNETFNSELNLDHHMYEVHPGQEVNCEQCNFTCPNYNYLKLHKTMFHFNHNSNGVGSASQGPPTQITIPTSIQSPNFEVRLKEPNNVLGHDSPPQIMVLPPTRPAMQLPPQVINAAAVAAAAEAARNAQVSQIQVRTQTPLLISLGKLLKSYLLLLGTHQNRIRAP